MTATLPTDNGKRELLAKLEAAQRSIGDCELQIRGLSMTPERQRAERLEHLQDWRRSLSITYLKAKEELERQSVLPQEK